VLDKHKIQLIPVKSVVFNNDGRTKMTNNVLTNENATINIHSGLLLEQECYYPKAEQKPRGVYPETAEEASMMTSSDLGKMNRVFEEAIRAMGQMMEVRDPYTAGHQTRVSHICVGIAEAMDLPPFFIKGIELAALIHDIGKLAIPSEILCKPGRLSSFEFDLIKTHSFVGYSIAKEIQFPWPIARIILQHHERMNGSGYPNGLAEQDILLEARILSVADVIEAMSSNRPYRPSLGLDQAVTEICKNKNVFFDGDVVDACLQYLTKTDLRLSGTEINRLSCG
jgi:putative two-component system response regulator